MAADIAKRKLGPKREVGPREHDELDRLLDDMRETGRIVVKEVVPRGVLMVLTAEYEIERKVRQELIADVARWAGWDPHSLPTNPELAWEVLRDAVEAGPKLLEDKLLQLERARDMVSELQEGLTAEFSGGGLNNTGLILKELVDNLVPVWNAADDSGVTEKEIDKLKELTAGLIKLAEECYDVLREE